MIEPVSGAPLYRKFQLLIVLYSVVMLVILLAFFTFVRLDDARRNLAESNQLLADSLAPSLEYAVVSGNEAVLQDLLAQSLRHSKADWVRVVDVAGEKMGQAPQGIIRQPESPGSFQIYEAEILQTPLDLQAGQRQTWFDPGAGQGKGALRVGTVQVGVRNQTLADRCQDILWVSAGIGMSLLLLCVLFVRYTLRTLIAPVSQVPGRISRLAEGDYQIVSAHRGSNVRELNAIEQQLNRLAEHLASQEAFHQQKLAASEQARSRLEQASHNASEFIATMTHELHTPLSGVLGRIDLALAEPLNPRQEERLQAARQSALDLLTVIGDIPDQPPAEQPHPGYGPMGGALTEKCRVFNPQTLFANCVASYRYLAEMQGLDLGFETEEDGPGMPLVIGDAARLRQIIASLLDNAIAHTSEGFVKVKLANGGVENGYLTLDCVISDSGNGIPDEHATGAARHAGNSGMGWSQVQRLIEYLGGRAQVGTDPGKGSSFRFNLPLKLRPQARA